MMKIFAGALLVALSSAAMAGEGTVRPSGSTPGSADLTQTNCEIIASTETAKIRLSKDVEGAYNCSSTAAGFGTAHPQGKGKRFGASSNGGAIDERTATISDADTASTAAAAAALAAKNAS